MYGSQSAWRYSVVRRRRRNCSMCSSADRVSHSVSVCWHTPRRALRKTASVVLLLDTPAYGKATSPAVGASWLRMSLHAVDLPAPLGPRRPKHSPRAMPRERSLRATLASPYCFRRCVSRTMSPCSPLEPPSTRRRSSLTSSSSWSPLALIVGLELICCADSPPCVSAAERGEWDAEAAPSALAPWPPWSSPWRTARAARMRSRRCCQRR
mmetsp:Transcript_38955/g.120396  ORF Transcript_38955/g.120396 Transcript_38955/m.120396 type:complete len:210 (+) Transcript_38955:110-739(+)